MQLEPTAPPPPRDADDRVTPEMIAAAWATWRSRHQDRLGPGPAFREALGAGIAPFLAELDQATADRDEVRAEVARLCDPEMKDLRLANGGIEMAVAGPMVQRLALAMTGYFRESGAENYVELGLNARDEPFERYVVTVQKVGALSSHQARMKAEAERDELAALILSLREANAGLAMRLRLAGELV